MKKGALILSIFIFLFAINFVSAQDLLSDLLNTLDESTIVLSGIFIIIFAAVFFALSKSMFKENTPVATIIAAVIAFLSVYGINKSGYDIGAVFFDAGISESTIMTIVPLLILGAIIFLIIKLKTNSLFVLGGLLIVLSLFVYSKAILIIIAVILFIVGFILVRKKKGKIMFVK
ncbi:MAG: hypothetical protein PHQ66_01580 [Candidatus Nanoarchaeia archaeon]|nr:hypothetical protein [Candidatus Nanoarchaeia archaeon]MDD5357933.1 hypothetical protein [Candidatus Nanoarchaeia archaeon]MDD5588852.1 hypothetical protein [Candidatus Nanoarchaeia archaeon]